MGLSLQNKEKWALMLDSLSNWTVPCKIIFLHASFSSNSTFFSIKGLCSRGELWARVNKEELSSVIARSILNWLEVLINTASFRHSTYAIVFTLDFPNASLYFIPFVFSFYLFFLKFWAPLFFLDSSSQTYHGKKSVASCR